MRATVSVWRASSTWASQYWRAPISASGLQRRRDCSALRLVRWRWRCRPLRPPQLVVEQHPRADVGALPEAACERVEERHRAHEMRREHVQQQAALAQRLADEAELQLLEVAQAAVDQLARAARGAGGEVALLEQRDRQPAAGGVERAARARRAAADDDDVEDLLAHPLQRRRALLGVEASGVLNRGRTRHDRRNGTRSAACRASGPDRDGPGDEPLGHGPLDRPAERLGDRRVARVRARGSPASRRSGGRAGSCGRAPGRATVVPRPRRRPRASAAAARASAGGTMRTGPRRRRARRSSRAPPPR